jgi:hypothetical protein
MRKYAFIRIFLWIIAGAAFGFLLMSRTGENWMRQFPIFGGIINALLLPAEWLTNLWFAAGFGPHGDAAFGVMFVFMVGVWPIYGLLFGLLLEWFRKRRKTRIPPPQTEQDLGFFQNFVRRIKQHKALSIFAAVLLVAVCSYCISKEVSLFQKRKYFIQQIDHKAVAEACLDILTQPEKYSLSISSPMEKDPMHNPSLPEVIRQLQPKFVCVRGADFSASVMITKNNYTYLFFEHPFGDLKSLNLVYQEGPSSTDRRTILYTINTSESQQGTNQNSKNAGQ